AFINIRAWFHTFEPHVIENKPINREKIKPNIFKKRVNPLKSIVNLATPKNIISTGGIGNLKVIIILINTNKKPIKPNRAPVIS
ncbi:MAG TPA: hypothetical protein PLM71_03805, partial [Syntrophorhabdaceae bacterium]|nr:hypothetical protein [Syntrophorhabdaceae bacterium]